MLEKLFPFILLPNNSANVFEATWFRYYLRGLWYTGEEVQNCKHTVELRHVFPNS